MKVTFLHPDLGIGGAERLIVDAACALCDKGHEVTIYTSHYNSKRAFEETRNDRFKIICRGDFLPRHIFGTCHIVFAMMRSAYLSMFAAFSDADVFLTDQISLYNGIVGSLNHKAPIIFYCHFPDKLLAQRGSCLRRAYRAPFDFVEEVSTGCADLILCNSHFTKGVFREHFQSLRNVSVDVLHPATKFGSNSMPAFSSEATRTFLSINRFERKKNIGLAIRAMASLRDLMGTATFSKRKIKLVVAGGYDSRVAENVEHHLELVDMAKKCGLMQLNGFDHVIFVRSFSDDEKATLLKNCIAVLYTPSNEHFGIVPLECMAAGRPVIADYSGGPKETVVHGKTGFLCKSTADWSQHMRSLLDDTAMAKEMGATGITHVARNFSYEAFREKIHTHVTRVKRFERSNMTQLLAISAIATCVLLLLWNTLHTAR